MERRRGSASFKFFLRRRGERTPPDGFCQETAYAVTKKEFLARNANV